MIYCPQGVIFRPDFCSQNLEQVFFILQMMKRLDIFDAPGESNLGDYTHKNQNNICTCLYTSHNYRPQTKFAKVMFSQASVILSTGVGGLLHREGWCAPPRGVGGWADPPIWILRDTVNERAVRIVLECILVLCKFLLWYFFNSANESDVFRVPDTSSSEEHRRQSLHKLSSAEVSDSFVEETSSSRSRSSKTSLVIPGSFVSDTPSSRSGSSKTSLIVHDSFVSDTPSSRSGSSKTSLIVHDSFVSDTSSSKSKSLKPSIVVPNSFVSESSSMRSSRNSRSSASTVPDSFVKDSPSQRSKRLSSSSVMDICIQETPSNGSNRSNSVDSKGSSSFRVPETVTTVPETAMELHSYKT